MNEAAIKPAENLFSPRSTQGENGREKDRFAVELNDSRKNISMANIFTKRCLNIEQKYYHARSAVDISA